MMCEIEFDVVNTVIRCPCFRIVTVLVLMLLTIVSDLAVIECRLRGQQCT